MTDNIKWDHEQAMVRMERSNRRMFILCLILMIMLFATNIGWIYYENSFEDVVTIEQEASSDNNGNAIVNNGGDVNYGTGQTDDN